MPLEFYLPSMQMLINMNKASPPATPREERLRQRERGGGGNTAVLTDGGMKLIEGNIVVLTHGGDEAN